MAWRRLPVWEVAGVVAVTGLAAGLRFYRLAEVPLGLRYDEGFVGVVSQLIEARGWIGPYTPENDGFPVLPLYFFAPVIRTLGASPFSLRAGPALIGTATIPIAYVAFRQAVSPRVAFSAAFLLAVWQWHVALSRLAYPVVAWPLLEMVSVGFLLAGFRTRAWYCYLAAGAAATLCWYAYQSALLFIFGLGAYFLVRMVTARGVSRVREVMFWGILGAGALLTAMPMIHYFRDPDHAGEWGHHSDRVSLAKQKEYQQLDSLAAKGRFWLDRELDYYRELRWEPQIGKADGIGVKGPIDRWTVILLLGGVGIAVWRWREPVYLLALIMIPVNSLGAVLTVGEVYRRSFGAVPFFALLGGLTLGVLWERTDGLPLFRKVGALAGLVLVATLVAYSNIHLQFVTYAESPAIRNIFDPGLTFGADEVRKFPDDTYILFYSDRAERDHVIMRFLLGEQVAARSEARSRRFGEYSYRPEQCAKCRAPYPVLDDSLFRKSPLVYMFVDGYIADLPRVMARYPGGRVLARDDKFGPLYRLYYFPDGAPEGSADAFIPTTTVTLSDDSGFFDGAKLPEAVQCSPLPGTRTFRYFRYTPTTDSYAVFAKPEVNPDRDLMAIWRLRPNGLTEVNCTASGAYAEKGRENDPMELGLEATGGAIYYVGVAIDPAAPPPEPLTLGFWRTDRPSQ